MKMHIQFKRSSSLQDYLNTLNKETSDDENSDDWGFFVDVEIDSHKEKLKFRHKNNQMQNENPKKIIHHHHYYYDEPENNAENTLIKYGNVLVFAGFLIYIMLI